MLQLSKKETFFEKLPRSSKKLVLVLATPMPVTDGNEEIIKVSCIYYQVRFLESQR